VIDACVHHTWANQADVTAYMSKRWQTYLAQPEKIEGAPDAIPILPMFPFHHPDGDKLAGSTPARGPAGSDFELFVEQHLERTGSDRVILSHDAGMFTPSLPNPEIAADVVQAINTWTVEDWASRDPRLYTLILVPTQTPDLAAEEIARWAGEPRVVGVLLAANGLNRPFAHPAYDPILAAAEAHDLPLVIHVGADALPESLTHPTAGGLPTMYAEFAMFKPQAAMTNLVSLICQGAFDRHPRLRVMFSGAGVGWLPPVMWRCDSEYSAYRRETLITALPSEYVRRHVRVCTNPFDVSPRPEQLIRFMQAYGGLEDILIYGSGYPNWDTDWPEQLAERMPADWGEKVFHTNALDFFRWERSDETLGGSLVASDSKEGS